MSPEWKRAALRMISYGLYVLTAKVEEDIGAATVSWVSQVSFEPALVMVALRKGTGIHNLTKGSGRFVLNILGADQQEMASAFFKRTQVEGNTLSGYRFHLGENGMPILDDVPAWIECDVVEVYQPQGDHALFIGRVTATEARTGAACGLSLSNTSWSYGG